MGNICVVTEGRTLLVVTQVLVASGLEKNHRGISCLGDMQLRLPNTIEVTLLFFADSVIILQVERKQLA